jgi:hypothetical protein
MSIFGRDRNVSLQNSDRPALARPQSAWTEGRCTDGLRRDQSDDAPRQAGLGPRRLNDEHPHLPGRSPRVDDLCTNAYVAAVTAQKAADATPVPKLSEKAKAAVAAIAATGSSEERAKAWRVAQADADVADELKRFSAAVVRRFGAEGVRAMLRAAHAGQAVAHASVLAAYRDVLQQVVRAAAARWAGEQAQVRETQKLTEAQRLSQGRRLKM